MLAFSMNRVRRGAEHPQEAFKDPLVPDGGLRVVAVQVGIQLAIGEPVTDRV
ncbi:hypothetical protein M878_28955 [Streptomyces roseochromogenus subsp. oscitans DS 12.976]|uniref:Uncharacterized protein n=1 Tax=Streptomyces roseochromogenus subsp. oscitans DS 12.976 TaxID=1352936 RepID=V6K003_STRRC|nr:hypothetical protein M878_28955 [Streptomyces roseochromogenus subsp. oscitans DS 12.976]